MPLSEDEQTARIAEALFIHRMELSPEIHTILSITLENLRWFKLLCARESISFEEITPEFLIKKLAGKEVHPEDLQAVQAEVRAGLENGELLRRSGRVRRKRG
ncbi:hypothetical protein [Propionivibrio sp.]|uniref:hypothetical protein n=1 Tax=Propionivibrio sp. TaxID=2212460 RepID=UPI0039E687F1